MCCCSRLLAFPFMPRCCCIDQLLIVRARFFRQTCFYDVCSGHPSYPDVYRKTTTTIQYTAICCIFYFTKTRTLLEKSRFRTELINNTKGWGTVVREHKKKLHHSFCNLQRKREESDNKPTQSTTIRMLAPKLGSQSD